MTTSKVTTILKKYRSIIERAGIPVKEMYLFGSAASGKMNKNSDIDVCVVSAAFGKDRQKERLILMKLQQNLSDLIEPHPYSPVDFQSKYDALGLQIHKHGIRI